FRIRFPWLLATIGSGTLCAMLAGVFEPTLAHNLVIAFFIALVLGLAASVSIQTMTATIQALHAVKRRVAWYLGALRREVQTSIRLGAGCGLVFAITAGLWRRQLVARAVIGTRIAISLVAACLWGLSVAWVLHACRLDPKIAAGPVTLALADVTAGLTDFALGAGGVWGGSGGAAGK